jgi:hypothetical protein
VRDVLFIGVALFAIGTALLISHFAFNQVIIGMQNNSVVNSSNATMEALNGARSVTNMWDYLIFGFFIGLVLALIITAYFIGGNPIFLFAFFLVVVIGVVLASVLSNAWDSISSTPPLSGSLASFPLTNHLIQNLPIYIAVIGFIGMIAMFAKPFSSDGGAY